MTNPFRKNSLNYKAWEMLVDQRQEITTPQLGEILYPGVPYVIVQPRISSILNQIRGKGINIYTRNDRIVFGASNLKTQIHNTNDKTTELAEKLQIVAAIVKLRAKDTRTTKKLLNLLDQTVQSVIQI